MDYSNLIIGELTHLSDRFKENELAYLAFTSKAEFPIRDRLAFGLHFKLCHQNLIVAREWHRIDLAILQDRKPLVFIQTKATHTYSLTDVHSKSKGKNYYPVKMVEDITEIQSKAEANTKLYSLLLATHFKKPIDKKWDKINKYLLGINRGFAKYGNEESVLSQASNTMEQYFSSKEIQPSPSRKFLKFGRVEAGSYFGNEIDVCYWLVGPFSEI
jgi:hypothetical protein